MKILDVPAAIARRVSLLPFFQRADDVRTAWALVWWWEQRRPVFNAVVGLAGIFTCFTVRTCALASGPSRDPFGVTEPLEDLLDIVVYGFMANIFYTGGWVLELIARYVWKRPSQALGPKALTFGMLFSVVVTLLPGLFAFATTVFQFVEIAIHRD